MFYICCTVPNRRKITGFVEKKPMRRHKLYILTFVNVPQTVAVGLVIYKKVNNFEPCLLTKPYIFCSFHKHKLCDVSFRSPFWYF